MSKAEQLKLEILEKVEEYYKEVHQPLLNQPFVPNSSRVNYAGRYFNEEELVNLIDSSLDFWLTRGKYAKQFEYDLARYLGVKWSLLVNSGSSANLLAFMALTSPLLKDRKINRGDEVITVAAGFPTTVAPIVQYGAVPVFVDVSLETANIDTSQLEEAVSPKTKAIMIAHTLGNPFDIKTVKAFCEKYNLWLIEDNCDALGSRVNGQLTGSFGDIGTSSFYPPHHITMGEGGAVYTSNPLLKKILLSMRDWGRDCWCSSGIDNTCQNRFTQQFGTLPAGYDHKYVYSHFGYNLNATDLQASIGVVQLKKIEEFTALRRRNYQILLESLSGLEKDISIVKALPHSEPSWFGFLMIVNKGARFTRNELAQHLESNKIQTRNLFSGNITRHPLFESIREGDDYRMVGVLPRTDEIMNNALWIGVYPGMTLDKIAFMSNSIISFVNERNK